MNYNPGCMNGVFRLSWGMPVTRSATSRVGKQGVMQQFVQQFMQEGAEALQLDQGVVVST